MKGENIPAVLAYARLSRSDTAELSTGRPASAHDEDGVRRETVSKGQPALFKADVRLLAGFFLLLDRWDRMSTKVAEQPPAPETTAL